MIGLKNIKIFKDVINKRCPILFFFPTKSFSFPLKKKKKD